LTGTVALSAAASHPNGIASVQFFVDGTSVGTDTSAPFQATWDTLSTFDGSHVIRAKATATTGEYSCQTNNVTTGAGIQGNWVGNYGVDGYALGGWNDSSSTGDLVVLPHATLTVEQGTRFVWANPTTDVRGLQSPDQSQRRAATWFHDTQLRMRLDFNAAYSGTMHLYVVDWDSTTRRQNVTVTDGTTTKTIAMTSSYNQGAWLHFPVNVPSGGSVHITADYVAGYNPNIDGIFLGGPGAPPGPPPPPPNEVDSPGVQGNWVGNYGTDGYALGGWGGGTDLVVMPTATLTLERGTRYVWANPTTDVRGLQSPDQTERRAATWVDGTQLKLRLDFSAAYAGTMHLYVVDWDTTTRRQNVTVTDGTTTKTIAMTNAYNVGAWLHFPINVGAGGTVRITADYVAGYNPTIDGIFLGGTGPLPRPPGDWVGIYGVDGYALGAWNGGTDLVSLPNATLTVEQGNRFVWANPTTDVRGLQSPDRSQRRAATWFHDSQLRLRLNFTAAYTGNLHLYVVDWDTTTRRQNITVTDGTTTKTVAMTNSYNQGAWLHFPISVGTGGVVRITADYVAGYNPNIDGIFLGDASSGAAAPGTPSLAATAGNNQVFLTWTTPSNGGSPITGYRLYRGTVSGSLSLYQTLGDTNGYNDTAASNGTTYYYQVSAVNFVGEGARSSESSATPAAPLTVPGTPSFSATAGDSQVGLSWTTPADGGSAITGYRLYRGTVSGSLSLYQSLPVTNSYTDTAVTNGTTYYYQVSAVNAIGEGTRSSQRSATPAAPATAPGVPALTATAGNAQVALSWTTPANGGSPITGYKVYRGTVSGSLSLYQTLGVVSGYTDTAVTNGTTYYYQVSAVNAVGEGSRSSERSATPTAPVTVPGQPTLTATAGNGQVGLGWTTPANGGSPITSYRLYRGTTSGSLSLYQTLGLVTSYTDGAVSNGTTYYYQVSAVNAVGEGSRSTERSATPTAPASVPSAPLGFTAAPSFPKGIDLAWSAPASNGGAAITSYRIYRSTTSGTEVFLDTVPAGSTTYRDTATKKNTRYYYIVRAVNAVGEGASSTEATAISR
jgi:fibronectin type 3 domain-containing protein